MQSSGIYPSYPTILQERHYYPFGMLHAGYGKPARELYYDTKNRKIYTRQTAAGRYKYWYNDKEWQDDAGLDMYDYGARQYDPAVGRWFTMDPMAEKYANHTPYNYTLNNPIILVDPTGMAPEENDWDWQGEIWDEWDDWFVNKKTGALVYVPNEHKLNEEIAKKNFGATMSEVIFSNNKNSYENWERLGDDNMFDTEENKVSENGPMYISENHAEEFAEKRGYELAIKTDVTEEINSQYIGDIHNSMVVIHNDPIEKKIHNQSFTYIKINEHPTRKLLGETGRDISKVGWDLTKYRIIKVERKNQRDFSQFYIRIHKIKGPIDKKLEK